MSFVRTFLLLIFIPFIGFFVSKWAIYDTNKFLSKEGINYTISQLCRPDMLSQFPSLQELCTVVKPYFWLKYVSLLSGAVALLL